MNCAPTSLGGFGMEHNIMWSPWSETGLESGFRAELPVDRDGLVIDYPGLFKRVWWSPELE
jgi:hypothetical protein